MRRVSYLWSLVTSDNEKLHVLCQVSTKYMFIGHLKLCGVFLIQTNFLVKS